MKKIPASTTKPSYGRGALFAVGGPIVGITAWLLLWQAGFIASIATFAMAWLTVWLYQKGAGAIDKKSLYIILPYIALGLALSILSGIVSDALHYLLDVDKEARKAGAWVVFTSSDFWRMITANLLHNGELWKDYTTDILIALALGGLGVYRTVKDVWLHGTTAQVGIGLSSENEKQAKEV